MLRVSAGGLLLVVLLLALAACGGSPKPNYEEPYYEDPYEMEQAEPEFMPPERDYPEEMASVRVDDLEVGDGDTFEEEPSKPALNADDYKVALDVTNEITLNSTATLRVWIGLENYLPRAIPTTVRDTTTIPASLGDYARITPYAPDFTVGPEESQVMRIVPSGSSVLFSLTPEREGEFLISARIELYDNPDLVGVAIPKTSDIVSVVVTVDTKAAVKSRLGELGDIAWKEFIKFWGAIVALILGALYFIIRKSVKKKTGFSGDANNAYGGYTPIEPDQPAGSGSIPESSGPGGEVVDDPFADGADGADDDGGDLADISDEDDPFA